MRKNDKRVDFMIEKDNKIKAIYKDDLLFFLKQFDIYEKFVNNKTLCRYCGIIINENNLNAIIPCQDHFEFSCNDSKCINEFIEESNNE